jgi:hypothetical protein
VPIGLSLKENNQDVINGTIREIASGRDNASGIATLTSGTSTTVANANCSGQGGVQLTPSSASAVSAGAWISAVNNGSFTITHSSGFAGATFYYRVHG